MITTLIKKESNTKISFNPVELGHSSYYQEFKCKLYDPDSGLKNLYFVDTHSQPIYLLLDDVKLFLEEGEYYPYVIFDINGRLEHLYLYKKDRKPTGYKYYTRINHIININASLQFENFSDVIIRENAYYNSTGLAGGTINSTSPPIIYNEVTGDLSLDTDFPDTWVRDITSDEFLEPRNSGDYVKIPHSNHSKETALVLGGDILSSGGSSTLDITTTSGASYNHGIRVEAGQTSAELIHGYNESGEHIFKVNSTAGGGSFMGLMKSGEIDFVGFGGDDDRIVFGGGVIDQIGTNLLTILGDTVIDSGKLTLDADNIGIYDAAPTFTTDNQIITKKYVDDEITDLSPSNIAYLNQAQTFTLTQQFDSPIQLEGDQLNFSEVGSNISYNSGTNLISFYINGLLRYVQGEDIALFNCKISTKEEVPDVSDGGLCLNQGTASTNIMSLKSSSVSHPMTSLDETDTYASFKKVNSSYGGLKIAAYTDSLGYEGLWLEGNLTSPISDLDRPYGAIVFNGNKTNGGTGVTGFSSDQNIFSFCNNGRVLMAMSGEGTYLFNNKLSINDGAPDVSEGGICLNQVSTSGNIISLKSSSISHPMTGIDESDTYMTIKKRNSSYGGALISGYTESGSEEAISIIGITGDTTPSVGSIEIIAAKSNGSGSRASMSNTERMITFSNNYSNKVYIRGNGNMEFASGTVLHGYTSTSSTTIQSFNVSGIGVLILTSSSVITMHSFSGGVNGQVLRVIHQGTGPIGFTHNYGTGEPIYTHGGTSYSITTDYGVFVFTYYDGTWYMGT